MSGATSGGGRLRIVFLGSGAFGLPTLAALRAEHDLGLVISQPDRPSGRGRALTPTPVATWATEQGVDVVRTADANGLETVTSVRSAFRGGWPDAFVVIAFGQKLAPSLLQGTFAINLHGSLLPAYRGAAPINWAMIDGREETGVSVISLADRMDAGAVFRQHATAIDPSETAGELHDRLALLGPGAVRATLAAFAEGRAHGEPQDELHATKARKLRKEDGLVDLAALDARAARCRVHGVTPWPGCDIAVGERRLRLLRVREVDDADDPAAAAPVEPGTVRADRAIACRRGALAILELQPPGGRPMTLEQYRNGHPFEPGMRVAPVGAAT